ncbi:MAG: two-component sensor histidine kinase [Acidimicrobiia bacterium]|nr:two-component sensor histidine kinase [Acidimicrobiia bacterium]
MRRRISEAIVGVAACILLALGIPLALAVHQSILDSEVVELQARAAQTLAEIDVPINLEQVALLSREPDAPPPFSLYGSDGVRLFGNGPANADLPVRLALAGSPASRVGNEIVVSTPINDDANERVVGALRLTESLAEPNHRSRVAWLIMGGASVAALTLGWVVAQRLAARLARPVSELAAAAARLGDGGVLERPSASGVDEIDTLASVLSDSSIRVNEALARERRFSADVSHQIRTPLTGMRLRLEQAMTDNDLLSIGDALDDVDRLERTLDHLEAFARDTIPLRSVVRLDVAARQAQERWNARAVAAGRQIRSTPAPPVLVRGSATGVDQVLDVLLDNALRHGEGAIDISARPVAGGGAIDVADEGSVGSGANPEHLFARRQGDHHGIGLALARSIAEAEGGRLLVSHRQPTTFSLVLIDPDLDA